MGEKIEKQKYDPLVLAIISGTIRLMVLSGKSIEAFVQLGGRNTKISKRGIEGEKKYFIENRTEFRNDRGVWNTRKL